MPTSPHRQHNLATADDMSRFIEQLPRALAAPTQLDLAPGDDPVQWQITLTLAPADQAALDALRPSTYQLCARAQHVLGLAAISSQIDLARSVVQVRAGDGRQLAFVGEAALWWIANTSPAALRTATNRLLGEIAQRSATP